MNENELCTLTPPIYSPEELKLLDKNRLPKHIAIIPDGNRRWAKFRQENPQIGHRSGAETLIETVKAAKEIGIHTITFFLFSTENWNRSQEEINVLMWLLQEFLVENRQDMINRGIRFHTIGDLSALPAEVLSEIDKSKEETKHCSSINMVVALNYGARDEIRRAITKIVSDAKAGIINEKQLSESVIGTYLDTAPWGDPDLFIRTSGESRVSNYLLWQLAYSEIYFTDVLWPDFKSNNLLEAIIDYQKRERRWGGS